MIGTDSVCVCLVSRVMLTEQIIGDVKRLEKNLALKKQFSARASSTTLTCSLRTHTLVVGVH